TGAKPTAAGKSTPASKSTASKSTGAKPAAAAKPAAKASAKPGATVADNVKPTLDGTPAFEDEATPAPRTRPKPGVRPAKSTTTSVFGSGAGGGKGPGGRGPSVKVSKPRNWGPILLFGTVGVVAILIIAFAAWQVHENGLGWQDKAKKISGIQIYDRDTLSRNHKYGVITYPQSPPVGGDHNPNWQRCLGDVYDAPIANEHAVHSLEHGAIWITYRPDLPAAQVDALKAKVQGNDFMLMSPYPNLDKPISLQAWGYQLKVDNASDKRIDEFIKDLRQVNGPEQASCSSGTYITATGTTPHDLGSPAPTASGSAGASGSAAPSTPAASPSS
ncbi:MAG TPA: DUF3105 domain-containing protein, partial [Rugosimonospora sp.]|nr:DUF3105 domain-containing protein [Rugosimonospora sp.]